MGTTSFILIIVLETLAICLFLLAFVVLKNRKLRRMVTKLQKRVQNLAFHNKKDRPPSPPAESYHQKLSTHIELTRDYHRTLGTAQDIDRDLDPDAPSPRRIAALRHAFLTTERAATTNQNQVDWDLLANRYRQILLFRNDHDETNPELGELIEAGLNEEFTSMQKNPKEHLQEIRRLRSVAAEQHKIITELQNKLASANDAEERAQIIASLQTELGKQVRFLQESETCIKLMEDELAHNNQEMAILKDQLAQMPKLKNQIAQLESTLSAQERIAESLQQENRRISKQLLWAEKGPLSEGQDAKTLRKELIALQAKYHELEEKFLDLKLKE
jgi:hypothetical protein